MITYLEIIEPFVRAIEQHVRGDMALRGPCEACVHMEPCALRSALLGVQDAAVSRWLMELEAQPLGHGGPLSGPVSDRIRNDASLLAGDVDQVDLPGETRS